MFVQGLNFFSIPSPIADRDLLSKHLLTFRKHFLLSQVFLCAFASDFSFQILEQLCNLLEILLEQFICNDLQISYRVNLTLVVHDFWVREGSHYMIDAVDSLDVGQKSVAETCSLTSSCDKASNVEN